MSRKVKLVGAEWQQAAQNAYDIQGASNSSGVTTTLLEHQKSDLVRSGTTMKNQSPVAIVIIDKLASLAGCQGLGKNERIDAAWSAIFDLKAGRDHEWELFGD